MCERTCMPPPVFCKLTWGFWDGRLFWSAVKGTDRLTAGDSAGAWAGKKPGRLWKPQDDGDRIWLESAKRKKRKWTKQSFLFVNISSIQTTAKLKTNSELVCNIPNYAESLSGYIVRKLRINKQQVFPPNFVSVQQAQAEQMKSRQKCN